MNDPYKLAGPYPNPFLKKKTMDIIAFDTPKQLAEWESKKLDPRLRVLVYFVAGYVLHEMNLPTVITSIYREGDEGVHGCWRGVDIRTRDMSEDQAMHLEAVINKHFTYDPDRNYPTAYYHDNRGAPGKHLHLQVRACQFDAWV